MKTQTVVNNNSISVVSLLGAVLVVLKLLGYISISWWWVTLPFWGGIALILAIMLLGGVLTLIGATIYALFSR